MKRFLVFSVLALSTHIVAQNQSTIQSSRAGVTIGNFSLSLGQLQIEQGVTSLLTNSSLTWGNANFVRYGLTKRIELNGGLGIGQFSIRDSYTYESIHRINYHGASLGVRGLILKQRRALPEISLASRLNYGQNDYEGINRSLNWINALSMNWSIKSKHHISFLVVHSTSHPEYLFPIHFALNYEFPICKGLKGYVGMGYNPNSIVSPGNTAFGLTYLVNKNLMIDFGLNQIPRFQRDLYVVNFKAGVSYRFDFSK